MNIVEQSSKSLCLFSGNSNRVLARKVCSYLNISLGKAIVERFSDNEIRVEIKENVTGKDVFVLQSTCSPVNDNLVELMLIIDALRRVSVNSLTAILPYYGYARQDRKTSLVSPISAKLVADLLTTSGVTSVITMDLHSSQIEGFFNVPVNNLSSVPVMSKYIDSNFPKEKIVIVSPDAGGVAKARVFAEYFGCEIAIIDKHRYAPNKVNAMAVVGSIAGKVAIIQDDMIDTAGTLTEAAKLLDELGAYSIHVCCTHPILSGYSINKIMNSPISSIAVTDTIPLNNKAVICNKIKVLSIANLLGDAVLRSIKKA